MVKETLKRPSHPVKQSDPTLPALPSSPRSENPNTISSDISDWSRRCENDKMENEDAEAKPVDEAVASCPGLSAPTSASLRETVVDKRRRTWAYTRDMLEVFSVRYMNSSAQNTGHLYGEIRFYDTLWEYHHLYNRDREHSESIAPALGDTALLTGPSLPINVPDNFAIDVALMYEYNNRLLGDEVISGCISWSIGSAKYNKPLFKEVRGLFGWVIVNYVVFSPAVDATVEVTFIKCDKENLAKLYGLLTARNSDFTDEGCESVLFRKTSDEGVGVKPGQPIPLSRSSVAVPWNSSLLVEVNLFNSLDDDEFVKGTAEFPTEPPSMSEKNISGECGEIRVKVIWDRCVMVGDE